MLKFNKKRIFFRFKLELAGMVVGIISSSALVYAALILDFEHIQSGQRIDPTKILNNFQLMQSELNRQQTCPPDSARSGDICVDKYEASAWYVSSQLNGAADIIKKIQSGNVSLSFLISNGAIQVGGAEENYIIDGNCGVNPKNCSNVYAVSIPGVTGSRFINWFQAATICHNANKRLLSNHEWQTAALGTPNKTILTDPDACVTNANETQTINHEDSNNCKSDVGVFDMAGNLREWVNDWIPGNATNGDSMTTPEFGSDQLIAVLPVQGSNNSFPAAIIRGDDYSSITGGTEAGVFAMDFGMALDDKNDQVGFRCAREFSG